MVKLFGYPSRFISFFYFTWLVFGCDGFVQMVMTNNLTNICFWNFNFIHYINYLQKTSYYMLF